MSVQDIAARNAGEPTLVIYGDAEWAILGSHDLAYEEGVFAYIALTEIAAASDSDGPRMAETNEDSARGEAGPARAEGIAQGQQP